MSVKCGYGERIAHAKIIELIKLRGRLAYAVALVYRKYNGLTALLEHGSYLIIIGSNTAAHIGKKNYNICLFDGNLCLTSHLGKDNIVAGRLDSDCIDYHKLPVAPLAFGINTVTGNAGGIFNNGKALAYQLVEKGGFTNIGSAHHRNYRQ